MSEKDITIPAQFRDINTITAEIHILQKQARQAALSYAVEVGRRLNEAKEMLHHGEWGDWLKNEVNFSERTAQRMIQIFSEYGSNQVNLFGETKASALSDLSVTKALRLLAIPEEEREEFVEENKVNEISTRELDRLIKERDALQKKNDALELDNQGLRECNDSMNKDMLSMKKEQQQAVDAAVKEAVKETSDKAQKDLAALKERLSKAETDLKAKEAELKSASEEQSRVLEQSTAALRSELEDAKKKLAQSDADVTTFRNYFEQIQKDFSTMMTSLERVNASSPETAGKLNAAAKAVLKAFLGRLEG